VPLHLGLLSAVDASYDYLGGAAADDATKKRFKSKADFQKKFVAKHGAGGKKGGKSG
jgi:hypothetical protein